MTIYQQIMDSLEYLKMPQIKEFIKKKNNDNSLSTENLKFLNEMLDFQVELKKKNTMLYNVKVAGFPYVKTIDDFDFDFQPTVNRSLIENIINNNFTEKAENVVFIGDPGVGKTHLSIALGVNVALQRKTVYFIKFSKLLNALLTAHNEGTFDRKIKVYNKYKLLIIDELGFNEISSLESKLFFQLIDSRYTAKSIIITSNIKFEKWDKIFANDEMLTKAILDRILHYSYLLNISGKSYRIKDKLNSTNRDSKN